VAFRARVAIGILWMGLLALLAAYVLETLRVSGDLRLFLPTPRTRSQRLILQEVSSAPASRLLLLALTGAGTEALAATSQRLAAQLRADRSFTFVANGENLLSTIPSALLPYRYLLSPTLDRERLGASFLHRELIARERDLASPAAGLLEPWLPRDPTLEILKVLESWEPPHEPRLAAGVWFNEEGTAALLIAETAAPAFDPQAQLAALTALRNHFLAARTAASIELTPTGPGAFSVLMQRRSQADARLAGALDTAGMLVLMLIAYGSPLRMALGALPLATAGVAALATVTALFGTVHGITIAFGFTLIGVAIDYPIFLFSHQLPGSSGVQTARSIWPTLAIAVTGLAIGYLAFLLSGVLGLEQLACFNVAGIITAGLATRYLLPRLLPTGARDFGRTALVNRLTTTTANMPGMPWLAPALAAASAAVLVLARGPFWENDLGQLTPLPQPLLLQYERLREQLGAPDVRYLAAVGGQTPEQVLQSEEHLSDGLHSLIDQRAISGFDDAARYLPSARTQERRRAALPDASELRASLDEALQGTAFRPGLFAPFLDDVARARQLPPLTLAGLTGTPLELSVGSLLTERAGSWTGLLTFTDVRDPGALERLAASSGGTAQLIDLKAASEDLIAKQRARILGSVAAAAVGMARAARPCSHGAHHAAHPRNPPGRRRCAQPFPSGFAGARGGSRPRLWTVLRTHVARSGCTGAHVARAHRVRNCSLHGVRRACELDTAGAPLDRRDSRDGSDWKLPARAVPHPPPARERFGPMSEECGNTSDRNAGGARTLGRDAIVALIPHQGAMCLLERVLEWDAEHLIATTATHRSPENPLRNGGRVSALHLCEYAAQAMALHGGLVARAEASHARPGMLVSLRDVRLARAYLEDLPGELRIAALRLIAGAEGAQYSFTVHHGEELVARGRAAIITPGGRAAPFQTHTARGPAA
jgi:predicted exporter/predicted hotdog family 3-hydroxylacyl-ACP dehydratase